MPFEFFDHTGDIGVRLRAASTEQLFCEGAKALTETLCDRRSVPCRRRETVRLMAPDLDLLLVDWLNELVYRFEVTGLLVRSADVQLTREASQWALAGTLTGDTFDPSSQAIKVLVKAVTYHGLSIEQSGSEWRANVVFDV